MNYQRLLDGLRRYGRETNFAYVSDGFRPQVRQTAKFKQWQRLMHAATWKTFSEQEKEILKGMAVCKISTLIPESIISETQFGKSVFQNSTN